MAHMCVACAVEFDTVKDYIDHERGGHVSRPVRELPPSPPKGPSKTEMMAAKDPAAKAGPPPGPQQPPPQPQKEEKPVDSPPIPPLKLEYKWVGIHKDCSTEVKTIEIDLGEQAMVVAYCVHCDKKLVQEPVIPIHLQRLGKDTAKSSDDIDNTFEHNVRPRAKR